MIINISGFKSLGHDSRAGPTGHALFKQGWAGYF